MPRGHSRALRSDSAAALRSRPQALRATFGNARELENTLERAVALAASDEIRPEDLQLVPATLASAEPVGTSARWPLQEYLDRVEKEVILEALEKTRFNRTAAAKLLGITFRALRYRMERLGIR